MDPKKLAHKLIQSYLREIEEWKQNIQKLYPERKNLFEQNEDGGCFGYAQAFVNSPEFSSDGCNQDSGPSSPDWLAGTGITWENFCLAGPDQTVYVEEYGMDLPIGLLYYSLTSFEEDGGITSNMCACIEDTLSCDSIVYGCMNPDALNYNIDATQPDECEFEPGCTDDGNLSISDFGDPYDSPFPGTPALNYDENAIDDDGSCEYVGCTDENASNFNPNIIVIEDDGSCEYEGCTDPDYLEFDPAANVNDGSCLTLIVYGCTDSTACNHNLEANYDDDSCTYPVEFYDCDGNPINDEDDDGVPDELEVEGCTDPNALNYDANATENDGSCIAIVEGCMDQTAFNYNEEANVDDDSCYYSPGCTDTEACNYGDYYDFDDGSCFYASDFGQNFGCDGECLDGYISLNNINLVCNGLVCESGNNCSPIVEGCDDLEALNTGTWWADVDDNSEDIGNLFNVVNNDLCEYPPPIIPSFDGYYIDTTGAASFPYENNALLFSENEVTLYDYNFNNECFDMEDSTTLSYEYIDFNTIHVYLSNSINDWMLINPTEGGEIYINASGEASQPISPEELIACVYGCIDPDAMNFVPPNSINAPDNDLCEYSEYGCTDETAENYSQYAIYDNGTCEYYVPPLACDPFDELYGYIDPAYPGFYNFAQYYFCFKCSKDPNTDNYLPTGNNWDLLFQSMDAEGIAPSQQWPNELGTDLDLCACCGDLEYLADWEDDGDVFASPDDEGDKPALPFEPEDALKWVCLAEGPKPSFGGGCLPVDSSTEFPDYSQDQLTAWNIAYGYGGDAPQPGYYSGGAGSNFTIPDDLELVDTGGTSQNTVQCNSGDYSFDNNPCEEGIIGCMNPNADNYNSQANIDGDCEIYTEYTPENEATECSNLAGESIIGELEDQTFTCESFQPILNLANNVMDYVCSGLWMQGYTYLTDYWLDEGYTNLGEVCALTCTENALEINPNTPNFMANNTINNYCPPTLVTISAGEEGANFGLDYTSTYSSGYTSANQELVPVTAWEPNYSGNVLEWMETEALGNNIFNTLIECESNSQCKYLGKQESMSSATSYLPVGDNWSIEDVDLGEISEWISTLPWPIEGSQIDEGLENQLKLRFQKLIFHNKKRG